MYEKDLALIDLQGLICHKTKAKHINGQALILALFEEWSALLHCHFSMMV